jgi:hypothetical protein
VSCCIGLFSGTSFHKADTSLTRLVPQEQLLLLCLEFIVLFRSQVIRDRSPSPSTKVEQWHLSSLQIVRFECYANPKSLPTAKWLAPTIGFGVLSNILSSLAVILRKQGNRPVSSSKIPAEECQTTSCTCRLRRNIRQLDTDMKLSMIIINCWLEGMLPSKDAIYMSVVY